MSAPWIPQLVVQRWVSSILKADAAVIAAVGAANVYPNVSPQSTGTRTLTHAFGGGIRNALAKPMRAPIAQVAMYWDVTGWEPGWSQQALEPVMIAVMGVMIGAETRGTTRRFTEGARSFTIDCDYAGEEYVELDIASPGVWAPIRERYTVAVRPAA